MCLKCRVSQTTTIALSQQGWVGVETVKNPGGKITRLETMLKAWEDRMFLVEMNGRWIKARGIDQELHRFLFDGTHDYNNWRTFRKYLLKSVASGASLHSFDHRRYDYRPKLANTQLYQVAGVVPSFDTMLWQLFPQHLFAWMVSSRRVFTLSPDLQALINATSLDDVKIGDLRFPFDAFAIEFTEPLLGKTGNRYDMLLFSSYTNVPGASEQMSCLLIPDRVDLYSSLRANVKGELEELASRNNWRAFLRQLRRANDHVNWYSRMHTEVSWATEGEERYSLSEIVPFSREIVHALPEHVQHNPASAALLDEVVHNQALRILAGVCLYLRTLPPVSKHRSEWRRVKGEPQALPFKAITDEAEVCVLSTEFSLSPEERIILTSRRVNQEIAGKSVPKNPHFRRGFWRRPRGEGNNPRAEKTVWVRPTVVNRHLLKEGELPLGAEEILLPPKH